MTEFVNKLVPGMFQPAMPARDVDAHKGQLGNVALIGGDAGMVGALLLASRAALLVGAGRIYAAALASNAPAVDMLHPEIMLRSTADIANLAQLDCLVIGPGFGKSETALELLRFWIARDVNLLLDADALNLVAQHADLAVALQTRKADTVITPHVGEAARLLNCSSAEIQADRPHAALELARMFKASCVLKGAGSICAHHDGQWFVNTTGNPGLAHGGTGDVLSGMVGGLAAQGLPSFEALKLAVFVHGAAADALVAKGIGPAGLTASEVAVEARNVLNRLNESA